MNFYEREKWIDTYHILQCEIIEAYGLAAHGNIFHRNLVKHRPGVALDYRVRRWAGWYEPKKNICVYPVMYAFKEGDDYDETIAHEVCHAYQNHFLPSCQIHGEMFYYLLRIVCDFRNAKRTHPHWDREVLDAIKLAYTIYSIENPK